MRKQYRSELYIAPPPNIFFGPSVPQSTDAVKNVLMLGQVNLSFCVGSHTFGMPVIWKLSTPTQTNVDTALAAISNP